MAGDSYEAGVLHDAIRANRLIEWRRTNYCEVDGRRNGSLGLIDRAVDDLWDICGDDVSVTHTESERIESLELEEGYDLAKLRIDTYIPINKNDYRRQTHIGIEYYMEKCRVLVNRLILIEGDDGHYSAVPSHVYYQETDTFEDETDIFEGAIYNTITMTEQDAEWFFSAMMAAIESKEQRPVN